MLFLDYFNSNKNQYIFVNSLWKFPIYHKTSLWLLFVAGQIKSDYPTIPKYHTTSWSDYIRSNNNQIISFHVICGCKFSLTFCHKKVSFFSINFCFSLTKENIFPWPKKGKHFLKENENLRMKQQEPLSGLETQKPYLHSKPKTQTSLSATQKENADPPMSIHNDKSRSFTTFTLPITQTLPHNPILPYSESHLYPTNHIFLSPHDPFHLRRS